MTTKEQVAKDIALQDKLAATTDRWRRCEENKCAHDLARGVLTADLLSVDGPEPYSTTLLGDGPPRRWGNFILPQQRGGT